MKAKNNALEFWRFLWSVSLGFLHLNVQFFVRGWDIPDSPILVGNGSIAFFFILTGYFLMSGFQAKKSRGLTADIPASVQSWNYFLNRVKRLLPVTVGGCTVGFIVMCFWNGISSIGSGFDYLMTQIFEFFGLYEIGMTGFAGFDSVCASVWYISVIMIAGTIIYYLLARDEDSFVGLWAPVLIIVIYALYGTTDHGADYVGLLPLRLLRAFAGISLGVLLYHPIEIAKKQIFTTVGKFWLTIGNIVFYRFIRSTSSSLAITIPSSAMAFCKSVGCLFSLSIRIL